MERGVLASIGALGRSGSGSGGGRALREGAEEHLQGRQGEVGYFPAMIFPRFIPISALEINSIDLSLE